MLAEGGGWLELLDIPGGWGRADAFGRGQIEVDVEPLETTMRGVTAAPAATGHAAKAAGVS